MILLFKFPLFSIVGLRMCITLMECGLVSMKLKSNKLWLKDFLNPQLLQPIQNHKAHFLKNGMLLERAGVEDMDMDTWVRICNFCKRDLRAGNIPRFSLANSLWVEDVPVELEVLTLPEKVLIVKCFPAVYASFSFNWGVSDSETSVEWPTSSEMYSLRCFSVPH